MLNPYRICPDCLTRFPAETHPWRGCVRLGLGILLLPVLVGFYLAWLAQRDFQPNPTCPRRGLKNSIPVDSIRGRELAAKAKAAWEAQGR